MDATQNLKAQLGELIWNNSLLAAELERVSKELEELKQNSSTGTTQKANE